MFWCCLFHSSSGFSGSWSPLSCCPGMCPWLLEVPWRADNRDGPWITWLWSGRAGQSPSKPGQRHGWEATCWPNPSGVISWASHSSISQCSVQRWQSRVLCDKAGILHNSTSFSSTAPSYANVGSSLPSPSLLTHSWTLATVCCSQCLWCHYLQNCEMSWVKGQQGQPGFCFLLKGDLKLSAVSSSFLWLLQLREQGMTAQGDRMGRGWVGISSVGFAAKAGKATSLHFSSARSSLHPSQAPITLLADPTLLEGFTPFSFRD